MSLDTPAVDGIFFSALKRPTTFILLRHGESEGNAAGIFQGHAEYPLNEAGQAQAAARGRELKLTLKAESKTLLFSSPLGRARESAELIAKEGQFPLPVVLEELKELDTGTWTGRSWKELRESSNAEWKLFHEKSWAAVQGAESPEDLFDRAYQAWSRLRDAAEREKATNIIAVSHGGFLQWLVRATFGCRSWFPLIPAHNCGSYTLKIEPTGGSSAYLSWESMDKS